MPSKTTAKEPESVKADLGKRFIAAIIDSLIAYAACLIPLIGGFLGAAYMLLRDGLDFEFMDKRSIGKKLMNLRVVTTDDTEMDLNKSIRRNWIFAAAILLSSVVTLLLIVSIVGIALIPLVMLLVIGAFVVEIVFIVTRPDGSRWGDQLANTKVIEVED